MEILLTILFGVIVFSSVLSLAGSMIQTRKETISLKIENRFLKQQLKEKDLYIKLLTDKGGK